MSDLISRADAIEAVAKLCVDGYKAKVDGYFIPLTDALINTLSALPSADAVQGANLINRHDAITVIREECWKCNNMINDDLFMRIMSLPTSQQTDCTELIEWLTEVVMDDEDWELNAVAYGEIICRKLVKLGVLEVTEEPSYYIRPSADAEQTDKLENQPRLVERNYTTEGGGGEIYHPTRQQGEWIWRTDIPIGDGRTSAGYICSNCGKDYWHGNVFKYCPSCGAKMKGGAE